MSYATIDIEHDGAIDWLCLNRPAQLNAMNPQMCGELRDYFGRLQCNHAVRIVVLHGAGRAFCAGYDLNEAEGVSAVNGSVAALRAQQQVSDIILRMRHCPQPIICLAQGAATGGGFALALASDVRIASPDVRMNVAMVKVGLSGCDVGISYFLPRAVGQSIAAELMLTGRFIGAQRALATGLVSDVVEIELLRTAGRALAEDMLKTSPMGLRLTKEGLHLNSHAPSLEAAIALEDRGQILCASAGHQIEGIAAFLEKRAAHYQD